MGGCASRPKESDMNNEGSVPKPVSENVVAKVHDITISVFYIWKLGYRTVLDKLWCFGMIIQEINTEESGEKQNQTETTETTSVEAEETSEVEPTKETAPAAEAEVAAAVEESSSAGEVAAATEKVENVAAATENVEAVAVAAAPEKVEAEPVKEEKEAVFIVWSD